MPYAHNHGTRIYYQMEGNGPPLVLHHWSFATLESWYDYGYVAALEMDYHLILLDARGHGNSDKPHNPEAYDLKHRVGDIVAILDDQGIAQAHFFGYSMGGWIGFGVALYAPARFKSLIIGGQHPYAQSLNDGRQLLQYGIEHGAKGFIEIWERERGTLSPVQRKRVLKYDFAALLAAAQDRPSLEAMLPTMSVPSLLVVGDMDSACRAAQECVQQMPNAKLVTLSGLDHGESIRRSDLMVPHITSFLTTVDQSQKFVSLRERNFVK